MILHYITREAIQHMRTLRSYRLFCILLAVIAAVGLICGSFWDLTISQALYHRNQPLCMILEAICFFPIYFPIALLTALLSVRGKHHGFRILGRLLTGIVFTAIIAVGLSYLHKRGIWADASLLIQGLLCLFAGFLMESALYALLKRRSPSACRKLFWLGMLGCCYLLWELACVQGLKALAGRPRYETLLQGAASFSPWYAFSHQGGSSFPSGHTAASCGILLSLLLPAFFPSLRKHRPLIQIGSACYIAISGFSRIVIGKHFLSDVCFAVLLMLLGLILLLQGYERLQRRFSQLPTLCN